MSAAEVVELLQRSSIEGDGNDMVHKIWVLLALTKYRLPRRGPALADRRKLGFRASAGDLAQVRTGNRTLKA
jgi:hypothetical protein